MVNKLFQWRKVINFAHILQSPTLYYSTSTSIAIKPSFSNFLIESLGFSNQQSLSTSAKLARSRRTKQVSDFRFAENANSVIQFFKNRGFDHVHIRIIVSCIPQILCSSIDKTLDPKFRHFQSEGFSKSDLVKIVCANPNVLNTGSGFELLPVIQALKLVMGSDDAALSVFKKSNRSTFRRISPDLLKNVGLLQEIGIPIDPIREGLLHEPDPLLSKPEVFADAVSRVSNVLSISVNSPAMFLKGIDLLVSFTDTTYKLKVDRYKSFGWTESDILALVRKNPSCLMMSESAITKKLGFLMNEMGFDAPYLVKYFYLLTCSLENRVVPRYKVLLALKEKNLIKADHAVAPVMWLTESVFSGKFVMPFKEVHQLYTQLTGISIDNVAPAS